MRLKEPASPAEDSGNAGGKNFRNTLALVSLSAFLLFFYFVNISPSLKTYVPNMELETDVSAAEERMERMLETEKAVQDAQQAKKEAEKVRKEVEALKNELAKAKEDAAKAQEHRAKGEEEKAKVEAEKLKLERAMAKEEAAEARVAAANAEAEKAKAEAEKLKLEVAKAKEEAERIRMEAAAKTDKSNPPPAKEEESGGESKTNKDDKPAKKSTHKPLNVLIFYPDDWGARDLQDVNPVLKTPTFSQLAKEGMRFTHNAVTTSICWISRACLFTGQYVSHHKSQYLFRPNFSTKETWTKSWPSLLQQVGYFTGHIGKWQYRNSKGNSKEKLFNWTSYFEGWIVMTDKKRGNKTFIADIARDETVRFLQERPKDKPFAATVAFYPPKGIFNFAETHEEFAALYTNVTHPEVYDRVMAYQRLPPFLQDNTTEARKRYLYRFEDVGNYQDNIRAQYATLSHIDARCGQIIEELKRQGEYDNTMIIVTADNGEFHGAHALADKWYPYSESIHVPLIIKDPRMPEKKQGKLDHSFTLNIDLAGTILGAAGLDPHEEMDGRDIADLYADNPKSAEPWREEFFYDFPQVNEKIPASSALVRKDWKYIDWYMYNTEELFDMQNDPFELNNVANRSEYASIKAEMKERMELLKHDLYLPRVPNTRCDALQPSGGDRTILPNCSTFFPDRCCPGTFDASEVR